MGIYSEGNGKGDEDGTKAEQIDGTDNCHFPTYGPSTVLESAGRAYGAITRKVVYRVERDSKPKSRLQDIAIELLSKETFERANDLIDALI